MECKLLGIDFEYFRDALFYEPQAAKLTIIPIELYIFDPDVPIIHLPTIPSSIVNCFELIKSIHISYFTLEEINLAPFYDLELLELEISRKQDLNSLRFIHYGTCKFLTIVNTIHRRLISEVTTESIPKSMLIPIMRGGGNSIQKISIKGYHIPEKLERSSFPNLKYYD